MGRILKKKNPIIFKCHGDKQKNEEELCQNKVLYFIVPEANERRYFAKYPILETLEKTLNSNKTHSFF